MSEVLLQQGDFVLDAVDAGRCLAPEGLDVRIRLMPERLDARGGLMFENLDARWSSRA